MTPADILAAARSAPLSPVVPARQGWLAEYEGPLRYAGEHGHIAAWRIGGDAELHHVVFLRGLSVDAVTCGTERLHLDLRIAAVRDHLVRCGAREWCRESVAGMLAWVLRGNVEDVLQPWRRVAESDPDTGETWIRRRVYDPRNRGGGLWGGSLTQPWRPYGWEDSTTAAADAPWTWTRGPEIGEAGRLAADLSVLRSGSVLEDSDGYYIPLPGGKVGWLPKEAT